MRAQFCTPDRKQADFKLSFLALHCAVTFGAVGFLIGGSAPGAKLCAFTRRDACEDAHTEVRPHIDVESEISEGASEADSWWVKERVRDEEVQRGF
jgi:hypothetical protein